MRSLFSFLLLFICSVKGFTQTEAVEHYANILMIQPEQEYENVLPKKIYSDSSATTFIIWVKKEVALHKHAAHTETIYVLEGTANMRIGDKWIEIAEGSWITVPENTPHAVKVTSHIPLKVLSVQTPEFDGTDRVMIEE